MSEATRPILRADELSALETHYAADAVLEEHHHDEATLSLAIRGGYEERIGRVSHACAPMSCIFKPPQVSHRNKIGRRGLRGVFLEIGPARFFELTEVTGRLPEVVCVASPHVRSLVVRAASEMGGRLPGYELALEGLFLELLAAVARHEAPRSDQPRQAWLIRARDYLHAHFRERVHLADVARAAGVHPVHLAQVFRRHHGCSVGSYVRELRIEFACRALTDRERTLGRIGIDAGFTDHSHFTRAFKAHMGVTPSEYRELLLGAA